MSQYSLLLLLVLSFYFLFFLFLLALLFFNNYSSSSDIKMLHTVQMIQMICVFGVGPKLMTDLIIAFIDSGTECS